MYIKKIYLFTSVLFLEDNSFSNKILIRNFLNAFEYSFQNFHILININEIDNINEKDKLNFQIKNKIIKSIIETINYSIPEKFNNINNLLKFIKNNETFLKIMKNIEQKSKLITKDD